MIKALVQSFIGATVFRSFQSHSLSFKPFLPPPDYPPAWRALFSSAFVYLLLFSDRSVKSRSGSCLTADCHYQMKVAQLANSGVHIFKMPPYLKPLRRGAQDRRIQRSVKCFPTAGPGSLCMNGRRTHESGEVGDK
jgi:hypothetical protein